MKVLATASLCLLSILQSWAQTPVTVPVVDKSEPGSPLQITGSITFKDEIIGNSIKSSSDYELKAQNVSGKGIVLLLVHFTGTGPLEGDGINVNIQDDNIFEKKEITPGTAFELARGLSTGGFTIGPYSPLAPSRDPVAEVRVLYAEFSDGSVYGQKRDAREYLASRSAIIDAWQRLDRAKDDRDFLQILAQKFEPIWADTFLEEVRSAQKSSGTSAARRLVHEELANAEKNLANLAAMRSAAPLQKPVLKEYEMSGYVVAVRPESKTIRVYNEDIPGFLTPREMDYEVRDQTTLSDLRVRDTIHATLLTDNEEVWVLENPVVTNRP
jgi:hypothetical protein